MSLGEYLGAGSGTTKLLLKLNGNANDDGGNSNNGTANGVTWGLSHGRFGQGASFVAGSSSNIALPSALDTPLKNGSYTFGGWFDGQGAGFVALARGFVIAGVDHYGSQWFIGSSSVIFSRKIGTATNYSVSLSVTVPSSGYFCFIGTFDKSNGNVVVYINGGIKGSGTIGGYGSDVAYHASYDEGWRLGALMRNLSNTFYTHRQDMVFIDNTIWTEKQVRNFYTWSLGRGVFAPS